MFTLNYKKKGSINLKFSKIEKYLIINYLNNKELNIIKYLYFLFLSINYFSKNLSEKKTYTKVIKVANIFKNFLVFYFIKYNNGRIYKSIIKSNPKIKFEFNWSNNK